MKAKIKICIIYLIVATAIFILSYNVIWITDSITYQYSFATGEKIKGIRDIFESQYVHYFTWNGRYVAHWLCQLFLSILGKGLFSATNAVMYVALIMMVIKNTSRRWFSIPHVLSTTCLVLFFCDTDYAPTCQIGYIWMAVLVLAWIAIFFTYATYRKPSLPLGLSLLLFSIIAGNAQEAINIGVGGALIIYVLSDFRHVTKLQWWMVIGFGIGGLFLCLSPASIGRTEENIVPPLYSIASFFLNLRVTYIFLIIFLYQLLEHRLTLRKFYHENTFYINAIIVLLIFNFIIGVGSNRQLFGIELFSCILAIRLLKDHTFSPMALGVFLIAIIAIYALKFVEIKKAEKALTELSTKISERPSGPIFIDFPEFNQYIRPTGFFRYGVYLEYALSSVVKKQNIDAVEDNIQCYPQKIEEIMKRPVSNQIYEYLPGEFILMQSKAAPKQFILHRFINIMGIRIPLPSYQVEFDHDSYLDTEDYNILYLPKILPIIENAYITIE